MWLRSLGGYGNLVLLLALAALGCSPSDEKISHREAQQEWARHEKTLERLASRQRVTIKEFDDAVRFFVPLTGIEVPATQGAIVDIYPTAETTEALPELRRWYADNEERLYWDERSQSVQLRPASAVSRFLEWLSP